MALRVILIFIFFLPTLTFAQERYVDSLVTVIHASPDDTSKVILINDLVLYLRDKNPNEALQYALQAKSLSEKLSFRRGLGNTFQNVGWIYYRKGDYSLALQNSLEALAINKEFGDKSVIANCLNNIGAIQYEQKQYVSAISYFKQGYSLSVSIQDRAIMSRSLNNISYCFLALKQLDSAEYFVMIAIQEGERADDKAKTGFSERILGDIYFEKQEWEQALESFTDCLNNAREGGQNSLIVSTLHRIGRTYLRLNKPDAALVYLHENAIKAKSLGYKDELEKTYKLLAEAYEQKKDLKKAYAFQSLFLQVHDSLYNQANAQQIAQMESRYKDEIKEARIALLTKDKELQDKEIRTQKTIIYSFLLGLTLLAGLAFTLYYTNQRVKRTNLELAERNEEVKTQAEQLSQLNTTKDKLFSIVGHDLRSPIAGLRGLMSLVSGGNLSHDEFIEASKRVRQNLDYLSEDLDNLLNWARNQLGGLNPMFEDIPLQDAITEKLRLFDPIAKAKDISLAVESSGHPVIYMDPNHLDLILRNLISNAIKFSHPGGVVTIKTHISNDNVQLSVTDSGVGMSEEDIRKLFNLGNHFTKPGTHKEKGMGIGLVLVKEFVEKNDATIRITSEAGKGSTFTVEAPKGLNGKS